MAANHNYRNPVYPNILPDTVWEPLSLPHHLWLQYARDYFWSACTVENGSGYQNFNTGILKSVLMLTRVPVEEQEDSGGISQTSHDIKLFTKPLTPELVAEMLTKSEEGIDRSTELPKNYSLEDPSLQKSLVVSQKESTTIVKTPGVEQNKPPVPQNKSTVPQNKSTVPQNESSVPENKYAVSEKNSTVLQLKPPVLWKKIPVPQLKPPVLRKKTPVPLLKSPGPSKKSPVPQIKSPVLWKTSPVSKPKSPVPNKEAPVLPGIKIKFQRRKVRQLLTKKPQSYICSICGKSYVRQIFYQTHMQAHTEQDQVRLQKPRDFEYKCLYCGKKWETIMEAEQWIGSHRRGWCVNSNLASKPRPQHQVLKFYGAAEDEY